MAENKLATTSFARQGNIIYAFAQNHSRNAAQTKDITAMP